MSAVARPTFVVVASLLANRATANSDDDDDESNEHLSYSVWIACGLFVILFLLFDLLRTRMWWVYEPRLHHDSYRARTPHAPGRSKWFRVAWLQKVFAYWTVDAARNPHRSTRGAGSRREPRRGASGGAPRRRRRRTSRRGRRGVAPRRRRRRAGRPRTISPRGPRSGGVELGGVRRKSNF